MHANLAAAPQSPPSRPHPRHPRSGLRQSPPVKLLPDLHQQLLGHPCIRLVG